LAAVIVWALVAAGLAELIWSGQVGQYWHWLVVATAAGYTAWALFWAPKVKVDDAGLTVHNVTATFTVPWAAIERIDTKYALTLYTKNRRVTAFAAPAPSSLTSLRQPRAKELRHLPESTYDAGQSIRPGDLPHTASGALAWVVREHWEKLRDSGLPVDPPPVAVRRPWAHLVLWAALVAAAIAVTAL
jgi:hypothetical protein